MALVHVTLSRIDDRGDTGGSMPVITSVPEAADTVTSSGTSAQSSIVAAKADGLFWSVTSKGDIWVKFGANPTAAQDDGHLILAGQTRDFSVTAAGEKIAIKDAA